MKASICEKRVQRTNGTKGVKTPRPSPCKRILIVDDHPILREGLRNVINSEPDLEVCGEVSNTLQALALVKTAQPDLAIVDITLENSNGMELIKELRLLHDSLPTLVLSNHDEALYAERCIRAGARGYLMKHRPPSEIIAGVRKTIEGAYYLSETMTNQILGRFTKNGAFNGPSSIGNLTDRELQVFELYGKGKSTREIAQELCISVKTVESHRDHIREKLNSRDAASLVRKAVNWVEAQNGL